MNLTVSELQELEPNSIWMEIESNEIETDRTRDLQIYSNQTSIDNAHLSQITLTKFQCWLEERQVEYRVNFSPTELASIWDLVPGCAIEIGKHRLISIPTDNLDRDELKVPQEWVDLPNLLGDYYLGVQVDIEARALNIWGFISHQNLKEHGRYSRRDRTYSLDSELLINNLNILSIATDLTSDTRAIVPELPAISLDTALDTIRRLSQPSPYSPRLELDFDTWGAILDNPNLRNQLYQTRLQLALIDRAPVPSFSLIDWVRAEFTNAIASGWEQWQPALGTTRQIGQQNEIERAKLIDLQLNLRQETVVLLIGVSPEDGDRVRVAVRVYPSPGNRCLPPQLQLSYVDEDGLALRTVTARSNDDCIQLPTYTCPIAMSFNIQLQLNDNRVVERFIA